MVEIAGLIKHPELMDRDTLYELRSLLALHPYYQTARLLMLQNLYLLHDPAFDEELRRAALYITDRRVIFQMIEAAHYQIAQAAANQESTKPRTQNSESRTVTLIDSFLDTMPDTDEQPHTKRKPTPADAAVDYVAYLLETEAGNTDNDTPQLKGQDLIDTFLEQEQGRIQLAELPEFTPASTTQQKEGNDDEDVNDEEYFTETLARIYIKQGRYQKALDIIGRLNEQFPHKNAYFADQMRFLEKLIINNNKKQN